MSNAKYGGTSLMPSLQVIPEGLLKGFVIVHPRWGSFTKDDYLQASKSVDPSGEFLKEDRIMAAQKGEFDLRGYEVADFKLLLYINPATEIKSIPKIQKHRADFYSRNEINQIYDAFKDDPMEAVVRLTVYYGFRRSEVLGLKWSAIDFDENLVFVKHTAIRLDRSIEYVDQCKNESSMRIMPLGSEIKDYLLKLREKQENDRIICGESYLENDYICKWYNGKLFDPSYISHHFPLVLKKKGLKHLRFHELRHSSASNLISLGFTIKEVQEWLGHSTITITADTYSHLDISSKRRIADRLDKERPLASGMV